jgi:hypothetical protein
MGTMNGFQKNSKDPSIHVATPTHLWSKFREFVQTSQIKGLDNETIAQLTNRILHDKNGKQILESKKEFKARMNAINPRMAHSPDEADACILALHAAILKFGFFPGQKREVRFETDGVSQKLWALQQERDLERKGVGNLGPASLSRAAPLVADFSGDLADSFD